ncbi:membrane protein insertion efficiency factor YidD [Caballeronia sp. Lep1P3]|uniref:membrane protein insertion efficiency factor YidD n=1 Tax=Caballeronia sp. Lep1P3 TaxID=2878150 RepID=UPI001FD2B4E8|nr:membrane protein insertion efficiency factor YidD [Caballeronia sp. Lep1P3]
MQTALIALLRFYKVAISPLLGNRCRFYPSCSDYAREAIQYHGAAHGTYLAAKRLCRCHPFSAGGVDLVPPPASRAGSAVTPGPRPDCPRSQDAAARSAREKQPPLNGAEALIDRH